MPLYKFRVLVCSVLLLALNACRKVIEPKDLPQQDPTIVLNAVLNTDSIIKVNISASKSIVSGKDYKYIDNAVCEVYEDGVYLQNLKLTKKGNYIGTIMPKPKKKYMVKVGATGYESVDASTTMPDPVVTTPVQRYDSTFFWRDREPNANFYYIQGATKVRFKIIDNPATKDYYSITASIKAFDSLGQIINHSVKPSLRSLSDNTYYGVSIDLDDNDLVVGTEINVDFEISASIVETEGMLPIKSVQVFLQLHKYNEDYYKYKLSMLNQLNTRESFFAEPVQVYNNINKGMGILAGDNVTNVLVYSGNVLKY